MQTEAQAPSAGRHFRTRRGDVVTVAAPGDYGKPRPAVVVQSNVFPAEHASVVVCQMTSTLSDAPDFRATVEPSELNGLRRTSQIMADKPVAVRRERISARIGRLDRADLLRLNRALAFCMGLSD
jgi:mRNA interferase MazF